MVETVRWTDDSLVILDQTKLPGELTYVVCRNVESVAEAIEQLRIRGAPAIGIAAAYGVVMGVQDDSSSVFHAKDIEPVCRRLAATRPTAVNLFWALDRMKKVAADQDGKNVQQARERILQEAHTILEEDRSVCHAIGINGASLLRDGMTVLTHCNAGALATGGSGTALAIIYAAVQQGKRIRVFADETRPLLQGARLTAWELMQNDVDVTLICDNAAASVMKRLGIDCIIVGADRIAANGDTANKIGTYGLAVLAAEHRVPFYVAAPVSTLDINLPSGDLIPIEERSPDEITCGFGRRTAPMHVKAYNPAFDVTPNRFISAIISEKGVARKPFEPTLREWVRKGPYDEPLRCQGHKEERAERET